MRPQSTGSIYVFGAMGLGRSDQVLPQPAGTYNVYIAWGSKPTNSAARKSAEEAMHVLPVRTARSFLLLQNCIQEAAPGAYDFN